MEKNLLRFAMGIYTKYKLNNLHLYTSGKIYNIIHSFLLSSSILLNIMAIRNHVNVTNTLYKIIKYCLMFSIVFMTLLVLPDCNMSFRNILLIVMFITVAYVILDLMIPNTVVIKLKKIGNVNKNIQNKQFHTNNSLPNNYPNDTDTNNLPRNEFSNQ